ncbi:MAG: L-lactate dehydrogenase [Hyphomonadaceae bacterium]|nr:L-lactate dehydrogenase [Hyphomonadaceae bacterium]
MIAASVMDYRAGAKERLPAMFFNYLDGGSYQEITLKRNVADFAEIALKQRVMKDVSKVEMGVKLFGQSYSMPVGLGPVGFSGMYRRRGEVQAARAAHAAKVPVALSTLSICSVEEVTQKSGAPIWYQFYMLKDRGFMSALLERVAEQKCPVLLFTVDLAVLGARYRDVHSGMSGPPGLRTEISRAWQGVTHPAWLWDVYLTGRPHAFGNIAGAVREGKGFGAFSKWVQENNDASITWKDLEWLRARFKGPIVIKGVLDPDDAKEAVALGADGVVVSNHGGRQLDGALSGIKALPAVADAIGGRIPVLMDGGVRSGLDVLRALALGAQACLLGRAWAYALAADGGRGVRSALEIIRRELHTALALTGCTDVKQAGRDLLA